MAESPGDVSDAGEVGERAYLGLGGNIGDVRATIRESLASLSRRGVSVLARSSDYATPAWGKTDQPPFVNACATVCTPLSPHELLQVCRAVEQEFGRTRVERWGARTLDIDILAYDDREIESESLVVPHPEILARAFVLVPLAEIAPELRIGGTRVDEHLRRVDTTGIERLGDPRDE